MATKQQYAKILSFAIAASVAVSCKKNSDNQVNEVEFRNRSITPSFIKMAAEFSNVGVYPLVSSEDVIPNSGNMIYGGAPDGQGFIKNPDGSGYIMVTNHENTWAISRLYLDNKLNIIKGDYIVNTDGG
ncbi:MAG TPA: hypothetical protein DCL43_12205, partial [Chitinophagaceae bacterium]|nr:hypothetical protein [Chitinophagaceae bacterium]